MIRKFGSILAATALAMLAPAASAKDDGGRGRSVTDRAFDRIQAGDPQAALALVEPLIAKFETENAGKTRIFCADTLMEGAVYAVIGAPGGKSIAAVPDGSKSETTGANVVIGSEWCAAQYVRAFALVDLNRPDEAQAGFERLLEFAPKRPRYLNELGFILQRKRQWQASIDAYSRAADAADMNPDRRDYERCVALRGIGFDLVEMGKLDDAEAAYRKCLAITPNEPKSLGEIEYIKQQRRKTT